MRMIGERGKADNVKLLIFSEAQTKIVIILQTCSRVLF